MTKREEAVYELMLAVRAGYSCLDVSMWEVVQCQLGLAYDAGAARLAEVEAENERLRGALRPLAAGIPAHCAKCNGFNVPAHAKGCTGVVVPPGACEFCDDLHPRAGAGGAP